MTREHDFIHLVEAYFDEYEGNTPLPDEARDAIRAELPTTQQRPAWWPARRFPEMNTMAKLGLSAAAVVVIAVVGFTVWRGDGSGIGDSPEPTVTPTASASPTPTPAGLLPEGLHVLSDGDDSQPGLGVAITVTIPAPDWYGEPGGGILIKNDDSAAPDGAGMIVFSGDLFVYGDPCQWSTTRPDTPATTVDELVAALEAQASRDASEPVDVTVGGYAGKSITLHVPADADFADCDRDTFGSWGVPGDDVSPHRYHQDPGQIDTLWILDVDGELVVIDTAHYAGTPQSDVAELEAIVASATFD